MNMQESTQYDAIIRQLRRLERSSDSLYRKMGVNGRSGILTNAMRTASAEIGKTATTLEAIRHG